VNGDTWEAVMSGEAREGYVAGPGGDPIIEQDDYADAVIGTAADGIITEDELEFIKANYGSIAYLLDDPDIRNLIEQAMENGWPPERLAIAMEDTDWFKETTSNQREWDSTVNRDPATAEADIARQTVTIQNMADVYGVRMSDDEMYDFAFKVLRDGMSHEQILRVMGDMARNQYGEAPSEGGDPTGQMSATMEELRRTARAYHMTYSDAVLEDWAVRIFEGRWSFDAAEATIKNSARSAYPALSDQFDQGMTLEDFFAPTKNRLAGLLEMNPNDIDLTQERWSPVTQMYSDDSGFRAMTYAELGQFARQQDEWWQTDTAINNSYNALNGLLDMFGVI
jgi:hypothetical protein